MPPPVLFAMVCHHGLARIACDIISPAGLTLLRYLSQTVQHSITGCPFSRLLWWLVCCDLWEVLEAQLREAFM